jgi:peroxiredoxin
MTSRLKFSFAAATTVLAMLCAIFVTACATRPATGKAPDFRLKTFDGQKYVSLKDIRKDPTKKGKTRVLLIDFWATWCPYCIDAMPDLQRLQEKFEKKGFTVVGIAVESEAEKIKELIKNKNLTYLMLIDSQGKCSRNYKVRGLPTSYLIDKEGNIVAVHEGYSESFAQTLEKEISELLKK